MPKVDIFHILTVFELGNGAVGHIVNIAQNGSVRQAAALLGKVNAPDDLGPAPVFVPQLGKQLIVKAAIFQEEIVAVPQNSQGLPQLLFVFLPQALVPELDAFIVRGDLLAEEVENIVKMGLRPRLEYRHVLGCQGGISIGIHELHTLQGRQQSQLSAHRFHIRFL